ncbi:MAG: cobalt-precorrin-6A reductase [Hyphomicrobiaceae bacterium]
MNHNLLILGGTTEASHLARAVAEAGLNATLSYAGRVERPKPQPVAHRVGGFGGTAGLEAYLRDNRITHVVDATHPFAAQMSRHAVIACAASGVPLIALTRPVWQQQPGDSWRSARDITSAIDSLALPPRRILLAIGRQNLESFAAQPQHHYVLRLVDPPVTPPPLPSHTFIVSRGPFTVADDTALMLDHGIELVVAKNAGGDGASAKLEAARNLGLPVVMIARPALPPRNEVYSVNAVLQWLGHAGADLGV